MINNLCNTNTNVLSNHRLTDADTDNKVTALWLSDKAITTQKTYSYSLKQFYDFSQCNLHQIRVETLIVYREHLLSLGYAVTSINNKLMAIKSLLSFCHKLEYIKFNVGIVVKSVKSRENILEKILSSDEITALINSAKNQRDSLLIKTLANTGLRISELINLKWTDINLGKITVFGKCGKTRFTPIRQELLSELLILKNKFSPYIFHTNRLTPLKRENVHKMLKDVAKRANLSSQVSCHWLRHSIASHALNNGASLHQVKDMLGHGSINTTARYLHTINGTHAVDYVNF